jgi:hypothetical protein
MYREQGGEPECPVAEAFQGKARARRGYGHAVFVGRAIIVLQCRRDDQAAEHLDMCTAGFGRLVLPISSSCGNLPITWFHDGVGPATHSHPSGSPPLSPGRRLYRNDAKDPNGAMPHVALRPSCLCGDSAGWATENAPGGMQPVGIAQKILLWYPASQMFRSESGCWLSAPTPVRHSASSTRSP